MSKNRRHPARRLGAENLETRNLLAGDVMVEVDDSGNLLIRGDAESNNILIEAGEHGQYAIIGRPDENGVDTMVNGVAAVKVDGVIGEQNGANRQFDISVFYRSLALFRSPHP